jgi:hypothetical protein
MTSASSNEIISATTGYDDTSMVASLHLGSDSLYYGALSYFDASGSL